MTTHADARLQDRLERSANPKFNTHIVPATSQNPHFGRYVPIRESQAHAFAVELLMPIDDLREQTKVFNWDTFFESASSLCTRYEISLTAATFHITSFAPFPAMAIHFNKEGRAGQIPSRSRAFSDTKFFSTRW